MSHKSKAIFGFVMLFVMMYINLTCNNALGQITSILGAWISGFGCCYNGGVHLGVVEE